MPRSASTVMVFLNVVSKLLTAGWIRSLGTCMAGGVRSLLTTMSPRPSNRASNVCRFYLQNKCTRGDTCYFYHPPNVSSSTSNVCRFYLQNKCARGDACDFYHPPNVSSSRRNAPCAHFLRGNCRFGDQCQNSHAIVPNVPEVDKPNDSGPPHFKVPSCRYYSIGACKKGSACPYIHGVDEGKAPSTDIPKETDSESASSDAPIPENTFEAIQTPEVISAARILFNCKVDFGSGASVQSLITAFESRHVQLSNLSPSVTETDLMCFVSTFVDSAGIAIHRFSPQSLPSAIVEFDDSTQAANAIQLLDNQEFDSRRLSARLALEKHVAETGSGVLRSSRIKISWLEPRRSAFAFYSSASAADKHAKRLDGMVFQGHRIKTSYQRNKFPRPLKVGIHNLPDEPPISSLKAFCRALHVSLKDRDTSCAPIEVIRTVLQRFGGLESFEALPTSLDSQKASAFVSFSNADAATAATKELPNTPMDFMGGMPLLVHRDFSVKYKTRARIFFKIKAVIESFNDSLGAETRVRCHSVGPDRLPADPVTILINGSDPKTLGGAKAGLEKILKGELVQKDGKKLWDEYFDSPFGKAHIHQLNANAPFFIHYNSHNRTIRLFGDTDGKNRARDAIVSQLQHVQERRHILPLQRDIIRVLLDGGLKHLKEEIGKDKFILNAVARTLTVDGEEDEIARVRRAVAELQSSVVDQTSAVLPNDSNSDVLCPVCFCDVVDPIKLGCGHVYCLVCLQHYLRSGSDAHNFSPLRCVAEIRVDQTDTLPCNIDIPYNIVRRLLSSAEEDALLRASFLAYTSSHPEDLHYCPSNDCEMVYRTGESGSTVQCPSCLTRICTSCHVEVHEGMSCAEYKDNSNGGYEALQKWRLENGIKQCPRCHADIEKAGGCNHMKCAVCKTHICWVCMKTFGNQAVTVG